MVKNKGYSEVRKRTSSCIGGFFDSVNVSRRPQMGHDSKLETSKSRGNRRKHSIRNLAPAGLCDLRGTSQGYGCTSMLFRRSRRRKRPLTTFVPSPRGNLADLARAEWAGSCQDPLQIIRVWVGWTTWSLQRDMHPRRTSNFLRQRPHGASTI